MYHFLKIPKIFVFHIYDLLQGLDLVVVLWCIYCSYSTTWYSLLDMAFPFLFVFLSFLIVFRNLLIPVSTCRSYYRRSYDNNFYSSGAFLSDWQGVPTRFISEYQLFSIHLCSSSFLFAHFASAAICIARSLFTTLKSCNFRIFENIKFPSGGSSHWYSSLYFGLFFSVHSFIFMTFVGLLFNPFYYLVRLVTNTFSPLHRIWIEKWVFLSSANSSNLSIVCTILHGSIFIVKFNLVYR